MRRVTLLFLMTGMAAWSAADTQLYKMLFEEIPRQGVSCTAEAERIAAGFKRLTGVALANAHCIHETTSRFDIQLSYSAATRIDPVSTLEYTVGVPYSAQGSHHTRRGCEQDLAVQVERFTQNTGLEPLVAYCYRESSEAQHSYVLRIDSFGKPARKLFISRLELFGTPHGKLDPLEHQLRQYTEHKLENFASLALRSHVLDYAIRTVYYSEKALPIRLEELGNYGRVRDCQRAKQLAESGLASLELSPTLVCVDRKLVGTHALEIYQVKTGAYLDLVRHPQVFASYAECEQHSPQIMDEVSKSMGGKAITAVCADASSGRVGITVLLLK